MPKKKNFRKYFKQILSKASDNAANIPTFYNLKGMAKIPIIINFRFK